MTDYANQNISNHYYLDTLKRKWRCRLTLVALIIIAATIMHFARIF